MEKDNMFCCKFCKFCEEKINEDFDDLYYCRYLPIKQKIDDPYKDWCSKYKLRSEKSLNIYDYFNIKY